MGVIICSHFQPIIIRKKICGQIPAMDKTISYQISNNDILDS